MSNSRNRQGGFTLIELLVVLGIIGVMSAVAIPRILDYLRQSRVRAAAQQLSTQISAARMKAVTKNANYGVLFVTQDTTTYWIHIEDDMTTPKSGKQNLNMNAPDTAQSTRGRLPPGVVFANAALQCPSLPTLPPGPGAASLFPAIGTFIPNFSSFRFNYLGGSCAPGPTADTACPVPTVTGAQTNLAMNDGAGNSTVCLWDPQTRLSRAVTVARGGRVASQ